MYAGGLDLRRRPSWHRAANGAFGRENPLWERSSWRV